MILEKFKIKNLEIPVIYGFDDVLGVVTCRFIFRNSGVCAENQKGLANLVAKIFEEGTKKDGVSEFSKQLEIRAINFGVNAGYETFVFEIDCLKEHFDFALQKLAELLNDPNLNQNTLEKLKTQLYSQFAIDENQFDKIAKTTLNSLMYEGTNLAYDSFGDKKSISKISLTDVKNFIEKNLVLNNLNIVVGGDLKLESKKFDSILDILKVANKNDLKFIEVCKKIQFKEIFKDTQQAYIYFGAPYNVPKNERFKAIVANFILGSSGFGSRLMEEIRVKNGFAYSVYSRSEFNLSNSRIWGYLQTKNENYEKALNAVKNEFEKFVKFGVLQDEFDGAKKFILGNEPLSKETFFKRLNIAANEFYNGFEFGESDRNLERISKLKLDDLNDFIKKHDEIIKLNFAILRAKSDF